MIFHKNKNLIVSCVLFIVTAIFSSGFLHPDEHYQILELLHLKNSNWSMPEIFNWDFNDRIRPWFQTSLYFLIAKLTPSDNPFVLSTVFRVINGLIAFYSLVKIAEKFSIDLKTRKILYFSMIWFLPFLLVRTNSESLSISMFLLGMFKFENKKNQQRTFLSGLFFGASFLARYQMGIPIFCINIYKLYKDRDTKRFFIHSFGIGLMIVVGVGIDYWGYGSFNISAWNYFRENIIHSRASEFGTSNFFYYFYMPILKGGVIIPILIWIGVYKYHKEYKVNAWIIAFWSFFLVHSYIPHKEIRFISFNYILACLMALKYFTLVKNRRIKSLIIVLNSLFLLRTTFFPANAYINLYKNIYLLKLNSIYVLSNDSGRGFQFMMPFYQRNRIESINIDLETFDEGYILGQKYDEYISLKAKEKCEVIFQSYPDIIKYFNISDWLGRSSFFSIWKCGK